MTKLTEAASNLNLKKKQLHDFERMKSWLIGAVAKQADPCLQSLLV